jgi:hypothetical protein
MLASSSTFWVFRKPPAWHLPSDMFKTNFCIYMRIHFPGRSVTRNNDPKEFTVTVLSNMCAQARS